MKLKSLLLVCGLLVASSSAFAELTVKERTYPRWADDPTAVESPAFDGATKYSIYNVDAQAFLMGANDWGTRASAIQDQAQPLGGNNAAIGSHDLSWIVYVEDAENGYYSLKDSIQNARKRVFCDGTAGIWADNDGGKNATTWQITDNGGKFTISNSAFPGMVLAVKTGAEGYSDSRTYLVAPGTAGYGTEWIFTEELDKSYFTKRTGTALVAHKNAAALYDASKSLWNLMVTCDEAGMTVPAKYQDAYANLETTVAEFNSLVTELQAEYTEYAIGIASLEKPIDVTDIFGFNPNSGAGNWETIFTGTGTKGTNSWNTWSNEGNSDGTNMVTPFHETWCSRDNAPLSDLRHQLKPVRTRPGVYRVTARARCYSEVAGATELQGAYLFANDFRTAFIDNSKGDKTQICQNQQEGLFLYNNMLGYYAPNANGFAIVPADGNEDGMGTLTFGFYTLNPNFNWVAHKDYKVEYLGNGDDALKYVHDNSELTLEKMDSKTLATKSLVEAYNEAYDNYVGATTGKEASENYGALSPLAKQIEENKKAWEALVAAYNRANTEVVENPYIDTDNGVGLEFADKMIEFEDMLNFEGDGYQLSTQEVKDTTAYLLAQMDYVINNCMLPGADVTNFLQNPKFDNGATGWQGSPTVNQSCGEKYGSGTANVYQDVNIQQPGVYEISCQGFYRQYRMDNANKEAWNKFFNPDGTVKVDATTGERVAPVLAWLYLNDNKTPLKSIFEEQIPVNTVMTQSGSNVDIDPLNDGEGMYWYPNTMTTAAQCFAFTPEGAELPLYTVTAKAMLAKGDKMRIGVEAKLGVAGNNNDWVIFDNFKLKYLGYPADEITALLDENMAKLQPKLSEAFDSELKVEAQALYDAGTAAKASADGDKMFEVASTIPAMLTKIENSQAVFAELKAEAEALNGALEDAEGAVSDELYDEIDNYAGVVDKIVKGTIAATDSVAKVNTLQCVKYMGMLEIDDTAVGTDDEPIKYTSRIISASFERNGKNSIFGWDFNKTDSLGNAITPGGITGGQTSALAAEYYEKDFDMYQEIDRLPAGTYGVSVKAFFRHVSPEKDWAQVIGDTASVAQMYVTIKESEDTIFCPVRHLTADATAEKLISTTDATEGTWTPFLEELGDATAWHYPNNMLGAVDYFNYSEDEKSYYDNIINVKVAEGDVLVIGVKQDSHVPADWFMMDNWQLIWYGASSAKAIGAQTSSCANPIPQYIDPTLIEDVTEAQVVKKVTFRKFFKNGQLIIEKDGKKYNATGARIF